MKHCDRHTSTQRETHTERETKVHGETHTETCKIQEHTLRETPSSRNRHTVLRPRHKHKNTQTHTY